jgi:hypothetical protein
VAAVPRVWEGAILVPGRSGQKLQQLGHDVSPLRRLISASQDGLALFFEAVGRSPLPARIFNRLDERLAVARRAALGRRRWLLSWHRRPDGSWLARLSGPGFERTIERSALTRSGSILLATRALNRIQKFRDQTRIRPGLDSDSRHAALP